MKQTFYTALILSLLTGMVIGYAGHDRIDSIRKPFFKEPNFNGRVTKVVDGDTLDIDGRRIRLVLVDAPEVDEKGYHDAKQYVLDNCPLDSEASVDVDDRQPLDNNGRILGVVYCDGKNINKAVIEAGFARVYARYVSESEFDPNSW